MCAGAALKPILLTGQRPGEITHMRGEHIRDGWWEMSGEPCRTSAGRGRRTARAIGCGCPARASVLAHRRHGSHRLRVRRSARRGRREGFDAPMRAICVSSGWSAPRPTTCAAPTAATSPDRIRPRRDEPDSEPPKADRPRLRGTDMAEENRKIMEAGRARSGRWRRAGRLITRCCRSVKSCVVMR